MELPAPSSCKKCKKSLILSYVECYLCNKYRLCISCDNGGDDLRWFEIDEHDVYACFKCIKKKSLQPTEWTTDTAQNAKNQ